MANFIVHVNVPIASFLILKKRRKGGEKGMGGGEKKRRGGKERKGKKGERIFDFNVVHTRTLSTLEKSRKEKRGEGRRGGGKKGSGVRLRPSTTSILSLSSNWNGREV